MKRILMSLISVLIMCSSANAGILLDPYVGYIITGDSSGSKITGNDLGVRIGYSNLGFGIGADVTFAGTYTYENSGVSTSGKPLHTGIFASFALPILFRGYATYFVNTKVADGSTNITGNGTKLGVQYTGLPIVAIGVEVYTMNVTDVEVAGVKASASGTQTQTRLAVSAPFNF
jgi:hypothetical protein